MRRTFWLAAGAVGGIYAYRKGTQSIAKARARGVLGNVTALTQATETASRRVRTAGEDLRVRVRGVGARPSTDPLDKPPADPLTRPTASRTQTREKRS